MVKEESLHVHLMFARTHRVLYHIYMNIYIYTYIYVYMYIYICGMLHPLRNTYVYVC